MKRIEKARLNGRTLSTGAAAASALAVAGVALGQEASPPTAEQAMAALRDSCVDLDTVWVLVTAFLVFWMQAGFAMVETGLMRAKNSVNICMKNLLDFCFATVAFRA